MKKIIRKILNLLYFQKKNDLKNNIFLLKKLNFNIDQIKESLRKNGSNDFYSNNLSWHNHLFAGFAQTKWEINVLEIGTYKGIFTKFLGQIFIKSKIYTCDLKLNSPDFINSYDRDNKLYLNKFLNERKQNLKFKNIFFFELNSFYLLSKFKNKKFDLIWIDGDHLNPQVTFDIFQCIHLLKKNGTICIDDIVAKENFFKKDYISNESYKTLVYLKNKKIIKFDLLVKRMSYRNLFVKKYIAIVRKIKPLE